MSCNDAAMNLQLMFEMIGRNQNMNGKKVSLAGKYSVDV